MALYFFKKEIGPLLREELMTDKNIALTRNRPIWVYNATTLELINKRPFENLRLVT